MVSKENETLYLFEGSNGRFGEVELGKGDCKAYREIWNEKEGRMKQEVCGNKNVHGLKMDNSNGEYTPMFMCFECLDAIRPANEIKVLDMDSLKPVSGI